MYAEDAVQTSFSASQGQTTPPLEIWRRSSLSLADSLSGVDPSTNETLQRSTADVVLRIFGTFSNISPILQDFFTGTHQRISAISKLRFQQNLLSFMDRPRADFAALCLSILLVQQMPTGKGSNMQSPLYFTVKNLITLLEDKSCFSIDLVHCRVLVTFYEMGHGLYRAAHASVAGGAQAARVLGLHKKPWRNLEACSDILIMEEQKRTWWAIVLMDRFINLCNEDVSFMTADPARMETLPIDDLLWSESSNRTDLERLINTAPSLDTPFNVTVGQLARECQISHLTGHVLRHVIDPVSDPSFTAEEAVQLERTLKAYLPLLSNEELKIGKYCGAYGMCNGCVVFPLSSGRK